MLVVETYSLSGYQQTTHTQTGANRYELPNRNTLTKTKPIQLHILLLEKAKT